MINNQVTFSITQDTTALTTSELVAAANIGRRGLIFQNNSDTAMFIRFGGAADAGVNSLQVPANSNITFDTLVDTRILNVYCSAASKQWVCYEA